MSYLSGIHDNVSAPSLGTLGHDGGFSGRFRDDFTFPLLSGGPEFESRPERGNRGLAPASKYQGGGGRDAGRVSNFLQIR